MGNFAPVTHQTTINTTNKLKKQCNEIQKCIKIQWQKGIQISSDVKANNKSGSELNRIEEKTSTKKMQ